KLWLVLDYVTPAASTLCMCVISIDRYCLVVYPLVYKARQTRKVHLMMIRDRKAAKALFILVFCFVVCWLPFEVMSMLSSVWPFAINPTLCMCVISIDRYCLVVYPLDRKAAKALFILVFCFVVCWLPFGPSSV
ncbi:trace amine-associated receptor 5-like, partial [Patella vulgata]|uniref:trace amine-associated receptor 5-like n=1 Tax=Patella vulgata TaxID=6465 RepID=UPI0024A9CA9D